MQVEEIHDFNAFLDLEQSWTDFCRASGAPSFFLSHAWFRCCWLGKNDAVRPFVLIVREASRLLGIAVFFTNTTSWRIFPVRSATLMQNQDSPFADLVLAPDQAAEVLRAMLDYLMHASRWHVVSLSKIPCCSPAHRVLLGAGAGAPHVRTSGGCSPILVMDNDWDTFWTAQSQRFKKTVRNVANRVERLGRVDVEELSSTASAEECRRVFASVAELSWKAALPISPHRNPRIARFFAALTSELHASGRLLLWTLRIDGVPIASEYHVNDGDTVYALRSDFDDRYREASPGAYLNDRIVRAYFERKVRTYDMGPGDNPYKQRWANGVKELDDFSFFSRRPYPMTVYALEQHAVPRLRQARDWWRGDDTVTDASMGVHS